VGVPAILIFVALVVVHLTSVVIMIIVVVVVTASPFEGGLLLDRAGDKTLQFAAV
jgi:hypothetical protein